MKRYILTLVAVMAFFCIGTVSAQRHHDRRHDRVEMRHHDRHVHMFVMQSHAIITTTLL